jgi:hypothetical protein
LVRFAILSSFIWSVTDLLRGDYKQSRLRRAWRGYGVAFAKGPNVVVESLQRAVAVPLISTAWPSVDIYILEREGVIQAEKKGYLTC